MNADGTQYTSRTGGAGGPPVPGGSEMGFTAGNGFLKSHNATAATTGPVHSRTSRPVRRRCESFLPRLGRQGSVRTERQSGRGRDRKDPLGQRRGLGPRGEAVPATGQRRAGTGGFREVNAKNVNNAVLAPLPLSYQWYEPSRHPRRKTLEKRSHASSKRSIKVSVARST